MPRHAGRSLSGSYLPGLLRPLRLCLPRGHPPNGSIDPFLVTRDAGPALSETLCVCFHLPNASLSCAGTTQVHVTCIRFHDGRQIEDRTASLRRSIRGGFEQGRQPISVETIHRVVRSRRNRDLYRVAGQRQ